MEQKKQKANKHVVIVTSEADAAKVRQFRIPPVALQIAIVISCIVLGAVIGYFIFESKMWESVMEKNRERVAYVEGLEKDYQSLELKMAEKEKDYENTISDLENEIQILSNTLNEKVQRENELMEEINQQSMPTEFPLSGAATYNLVEGEQPVCEFVSDAKGTVVATAKGTVIAVNDDLEYGHNVWVDHGNGYITIYRSKHTALVSQGDAVVRGTTLFLIEEAKEKFGYQIVKEGEYVNPLDFMAING